MHAQGQKLAVFVKRQLGVAGMVAAMRVADESFAAVGCPFDVAVELFRGPDQAHVFSVKVNFGAKAAAHVGCNHTHLVLGQAHHKGGEQQAFNVRVLVGHIQRVVVIGAAVGTNSRTRLHCVGHQAVVGQVDFGDVRSMGKSGINQRLVANRPFVAMVVGCGFVQSGRCFGLGHVDDGGQYHHHGHMVAHITHLALGKNRVWRLFHRVAVCRSDTPAAGQAVDFVVGNIGADKNIEHARSSFGSRKVDAVDVGVCVW